MGEYIRVREDGYASVSVCVLIYNKSSPKNSVCLLVRTYVWCMCVWGGDLYVSA